MSYYDSGLLNDYGGGNVEWWRDYIRAEVGRCNDFWEQQVKQLEEQIADMNDAYKVVMDEKCADDEIHCTCVPALRQQIKQLEDERRMYLDEKATFKEQVKQLEDMLKDIKNADKRFLQLSSRGKRIKQLEEENKKLEDRINRMQYQSVQSAKKALEEK